MICLGQTPLLMQMGVERIYLDAVGETAKDVWCAIGFSVITEAQHKILAYQYTLVLNALWCIAARCIKLVPSKAALLSQVSCALHKHVHSCLLCPTLCCNNFISTPPTTTPPPTTQARVTLGKQLQQYACTFVSLDIIMLPLLHSLTLD